jgi:hypothetical protein
MIFSAALPHSFLLYPMIWNDPCSDAFFMAFEVSLTWIACLNALEVSFILKILKRVQLLVVWVILITKQKLEMILR